MYVYNSLLDRQKIAKKLCTSIAKETKCSEKLFAKYCSAMYGLNSKEPQPSLQDVLQPQSEFWTKTTLDNIPDAKIPWKTKRTFV